MYIYISINIFIYMAENRRCRISKCESLLVLANHFGKVIRIIANHLGDLRITFRKKTLFYLI